MEAGWLVVSAMGLFPAYFAWRGRGMALRLGGAARVATGDVAKKDGFVSCRGKVVPTTKLVAPLSKTPCVYWMIDIDVRSEERNASNQRSYHNVTSKTGGGRFQLDDGSRKVSVSSELYEPGTMGLVRTYRGLAPMRGIGEYLLDDAIDKAAAAIGLGGDKEYGARRATEYVLPLDVSLLVVGQARGGVISARAEHMFVSRLSRPAAIAWLHGAWLSWSALSLFLVLIGMALVPDASRNAIFRWLHLMPR